MKEIQKIKRVHLAVFLISAVLFIPLAMLVLNDIWFGDRVTFLGLTEMLMLVLAAGMLYHLVSLIWFIIFSSKNISAAGRSWVQAETSDPSCLWWKKPRICLAPHCIIYVGKSVHVLPYDDIKWTYIASKSSVHPGRYVCILFRTGDGRRHFTRAVDECKYTDELEEVIYNIHAKRPEILIGFTYENKEKYNKGVF